MATGSDFVIDALDMIGVHASETAIEPEEMQLSIRMLNDYMSEIDEAGTEFGFVPLQSEANEVRLRRGAVHAIKVNLAGLLSIPFKKPISIELAAAIKSANKSLLRMTVTFGSVKVSSTLPRGSGNRRTTYEGRFFPKQDKANF